MGWNKEASAALVYLILYAIVFFVMIFGYATRALKFKSRYLIILLHITIRLASEACGLTFGIVGYSNVDVLVAYFILVRSPCRLPQINY